MIAKCMMTIGKLAVTKRDDIDPLVKQDLIEEFDDLPSLIYGFPQMQHGIQPDSEAAATVLQPDPHGIGQDSLSQHDYSLSQHDDSVSQHDDSLSQHDDSLSQHDDSVSQPDDSLSKHDDSMSQHEDSDLQTTLRKKSWRSRLESIRCRFTRLLRRPTRSTTSQG